MRRPRGLVWVVTAWTVVAITLGAVGCGKKADPQPPLVRRADTTRDLAAYQDANEVVLDWGYPSMTTAGGPLPDPENGTIPVPRNDQLVEIAQVAHVLAQHPLDGLPAVPVCSSRAT